MKISFNSKVILTFSALCVAVKIVDSFIPGFTKNFFTVRATMSFTNPLDYFRLVSHVIGHVSWDHLFWNLLFILLLGPMLEEKYGHSTILKLIVFTALVTGLVNVLLFSNVTLLGASGIVFMLIILSSIVGKNDGSIPIEFLIVACIFLGREIIPMFKADNISQMAHILGGGCGAVFGFVITKSKINKKEV